jgi:hypothetical protein
LIQKMRPDPAPWLPQLPAICKNAGIRATPSFFLSSFRPRPAMPLMFSLVSTAACGAAP